jgi:tRNA pseudouridine32 synthase/23S rRNA pseudouridine746 synthase
MSVVFENEAVLAVDKPAGTLTVPSRLGAADERPCLGRMLEAAHGVRLWPVHRLDFEVSGLVIFAKTAAAHRIASQAFEGRRVHKHYEALCEGEAAVPASFRWESLLVRGKKRSFAAPHGARAVTHARAVARIDGAGLLAAGQSTTLLRFELEPETGRPHQLRVHLATAGFPIAGDRLYGAKTTLRAPHAIALRAVRLELDEAARAALGLPPALVVPGLVLDPPQAAPI